MEPAGLVVGDSGRVLELDREGDGFYEQFADALVHDMPGSTENALTAAWRGSWPRPIGPPPENLRLAVGTLIASAISTVSAAADCTERDDPPAMAHEPTLFREFAKQFVDDAARGAAQLAAWQRRALQLAAGCGMAENSRKRRRTSFEGSPRAPSPAPPLVATPSSAPFSHS